LGAYRLNLLGPFGLFAPDGQRIDIRSRKAVAMVAMLAMAPNGVRTRSWLQSRLRRELANLAALLADHDGAALLRRGQQRIELDLDQIDLDVHQLALNGSRTDLRKQGEFLEGLDLPDCDEFEDWLREQRSHFAGLARQLPPITARVAHDPATIPGASLSSTARLSPDAYPAIPPKPSLVVLPFKVTSSSVADDWLGESMAEQLGLTLTQFPQLFVVASSAGAALSARGLAPGAIATELGVRYVLTGSLRIMPDAIRVSVQLIDGKTSQQIWGRAFRSSLAELLQLEEDIALAAAPQVWTQIDLSERHKGRIAQVSDPDSYALYWRANALFREWRSESTREAVRLTDVLVARNPECALSLALAGFCNAIAYGFGWSDVPSVTQRKAIKHYQNALRLGPDNVEAIGYAVGTLVLVGGDMRIADHLISHALSLLPAHQPTLFWGGLADIAMGNGTRARERLELSLRINPSSGVRAYALTGIGLSLLMEGQHSEALTALEKATLSAPDLTLAQAGLAVSAMFAGEPDKARLAALAVDEHGGINAATFLLRNEAHRELLRRGLTMVPR
jgi:TolB-like protein